MSAHHKAFRRRSLSVFCTTMIASTALSFPALSLAASFQILEQSPALLGQAFAGTASQAQDASTVFFNPSAIGELNGPRITLGGNAIFTEATFNDTGSNINGTGGKTDETGLVPNFYYVQPINERLTFGFGANAPFGLASKYDDDWIGRYLATDSELEVMNINAVLAYQFNDYWSGGIGLNYQRADVTLESRIDSTFGINPSPATDSAAKITGDDDDIVADVSVFFKPREGTRVGLVWRQGGEFDLQGDAEFTASSACTPGAGYPTGAPPAPRTGTICAVTLATLEGDAHAKVNLPDTVTMSVSQQINDYWWAHADIAWTQWSNIENIDVINSGNNVQISQLALHYDDTMRYAVGFSRRSDSPWTWRVGLAFDETPQNNPSLVNPRIPDEDRVWMSTGVNYAFSENFSVDLGYTYINVAESAMDNTDPVTGHHVEGTFDADVQIVGLQANLAF